MEETLTLDSALATADEHIARLNKVLKLFDMQVSTDQHLATIDAEESATEWPV